MIKWPVLIKSSYELKGEDYFDDFFLECDYVPQKGTVITIKAKPYYVLFVDLNITYERIDITLGRP